LPHLVFTRYRRLDAPRTLLEAKRIQPKALIPVNKAWLDDEPQRCGEMPQPAELLIIAARRFTAPKHLLVHCR